MIFKYRYALTVVIGCLVVVGCLTFSAPMLHGDSLEQGIIMEISCQGSPFAKIHRFPSGESDFFHEVCGSKVKIVGIYAVWVEVKEIDGKFSGYIDRNSLVPHQDKDQVAPASREGASLGKKQIQTTPEKDVFGVGVSQDTHKSVVQQSSSLSSSAPPGSSLLSLVESEQTEVSEASPFSPQLKPEGVKQPAKSPSAESTSLVESQSTSTRPRPGVDSITRESTPQTEPLSTSSPALHKSAEAATSATTSISTPVLEKSDARLLRQRPENLPLKGSEQCSDLYMKMSAGRVLTKEEADRLKSCH